MKRRNHARVVRTSTSSGTRARRGFANRLVTLGTLAVSAILVLTACGPDELKPYSTTSPASPTADQSQSLYKLACWLSLIVWIGVQFLIIYGSLRFRRKDVPQDRPPQIHGNKRLEIAWTIIPAIILLVVLIPTITTLYDQDAALAKSDLVVDVYGKQWWWEMHYSTDDAQGNKSLNVVTANELHLPQGKNVKVRLHSNNVIHSFWVPRLAGKMDVIPGHVNEISITPMETGDFYGECAEFCGTEHAWMRFKVIVQPERQFFGWVNDWRTGNLVATSQDGALPAGVVRAPAKFSLCLACHQINGAQGSVPIEAVLAPDSQVAGIGAAANYGPNLTNIGCRSTVAAGMLTNNVENVTRWLENPGAVKPGNYMAQVIKGPGPNGEKPTLSPEEARQLAVFLETLKPADGCDGMGTPVASPEASPEASPAASPVAVKP
ncbi:MAG: cytochrome c oxidase subunit II [Thermomicrobiales bacterium]